MIQEFQVSKEKLVPKGNKGHTVFRVPLAHLVKKAKEVLEVTPEQLVPKAQWEKGVLLAIVAFRAQMDYLAQRVLKESVALSVLQDPKEARATQGDQVNLAFQALGV